VEHRAGWDVSESAEEASLMSLRGHFLSCLVGCGKPNAQSTEWLGTASLALP